MFPWLASAIFAPLLGAQQVPGRDLLDFPVGTTGEPPPLARLSGVGIWNPAAIVLPSDARGRVSAAALQTPADQGVTLQLLAVAARLPADRTLALSVVRAWVDGLVRTNLDPQSVGPEIAYNTTVVSAALAQRRDNLAAGVAARYRFGEADGNREGVFGLDGGVQIEHLFPMDLAIGVSSFLWRPGDEGSDQWTLAAATDVRVFGPDSLHQLRGGYAFSATGQSADQHSAYASGRYMHWEGRIGLSRYAVHGMHDWRTHLGVALRYSRYTVGVAREENGAGLAPIYQFTLVMLIK
ncbi:MAG: hypothetical protein ACRENI_04220 [Gemmatimonadaceae bacterium]